MVMGQMTAVQVLQGCFQGTDLWYIISIYHKYVHTIHHERKEDEKHTKDNIILRKKRLFVVVSAWI